MIEKKNIVKASGTLEHHGHYLTLAETHITWVVVAMDSCFGLVGRHQHGIAVGKKKGTYCLGSKGQST